MAVFRIHLRRTTVYDEYYLIEADDEDDAIDAAHDPGHMPYGQDEGNIEYELQAIEEVE